MVIPHNPNKVLILQLKSVAVMYASHVLPTYKKEDNSCNPAPVVKWQRDLFFPKFFPTGISNMTQGLLGLIML